MKIARVEALPMYPKVVKEAWTEDEYVWPSRPPSFLIRVTTENGEYGVGEVTSQVWYLGETEAHIAACVALYDKALRGQDPRNFALVHQLMEAQVARRHAGQSRCPLGRRHGGLRPRRQGARRAGPYAPRRSVPDRVRDADQPLPQDAGGDGGGLRRMRQGGVQGAQDQGRRHGAGQGLEPRQSAHRARHPARRARGGARRRLHRRRRQPRLAQRAMDRLGAEALRGPRQPLDRAATAARGHRRGGIRSGQFRRAGDPRRIGLVAGGAGEHRPAWAHATAWC